MLFRERVKTGEVRTKGGSDGISEAWLVIGEDVRGAFSGVGVGNRGGKAFGEGVDRFAKGNERERGNSC